MKHTLAILFALVVVTAACGDDDTPVASDDPDPVPTTTAPTASNPDDPSVPAGRWTLVMLVEEGDMAIPLPADATIDLNIDGSDIGGTAACNSYGGVMVAGADGTFAARELAQTEMACEPAELMDMEARYLRALAESTSWVVEDGRLELTGPRAALRFEPTAG